MIKEIVIHTCCADCLLNYITFLEEENQIDKDTKLFLFFYNPNIHPRSEYLERLKAFQQVVETDLKDRNTKIVIPDYRPKEYFEEIIGKGNRCESCWQLRLSKTFEYARNNNIENVSSTLLSSHYQDKDTIIKIGKLLEDNSTHFIYPENPHEQQKHGGFYKQNFCGCCYSLTERLWEKYSK